MVATTEVEVEVIVLSGVVVVVENDPMRLPWLFVRDSSAVVSGRAVVSGDDEAVRVMVEVVVVSEDEESGTVTVEVVVVSDDEEARRVTVEVVVVTSEVVDVVENDPMRLP